MPVEETGGPFDYAMPAEVYIGRGTRQRPGLRFKGFDTAAEAIRYVMEKPRAAGEVATIECDDQRYGLAQIAALYNDPRYPLTRLPAAEEPPAPRRVDIAIPVTRGAGRVRTVEPAAPVVPLRLAANDDAVSARPRHRFEVGARLRMNNGGNSLARQASFCRVTFVLPYEGGQLLYRVKSELESFERVVAEVDLAPA